MYENQAKDWPIYGWEALSVIIVFLFMYKQDCCRQMANNNSLVPVWCFWKSATYADCHYQQWNSENHQKTNKQKTLQINKIMNNNL